MKKLCPRWRCAQKLQQKLARAALKQLGIERLEVILIPSSLKKSPWDRIRVAINHNPSWYKELYNNHSSTGSMRIKTVNALKRVAGGWIDPFGLEDEILLELSRDETVCNYY